jgi:hypothetical protein
MSDPQSDLAGAAPQTPGAVRLVFEIADGEVRLVGRQAVDVVVPDVDPVTGYEGEQGFWVETRTGDGTTLHRRVLPDPFVSDVEVFAADPDGSIARVPDTEPSRLVTVLVPASEAADHVALFSSAARPTGGSSEVTVAEQAPAVEIARFTLREGTR